MRSSRRWLRRQPEKAPGKRGPNAAVTVAVSGPQTGVEIAAVEIAAVVIAAGLIEVVIA